MMIMLFSHRHGKDDRFLAETRDEMNNNPSRALHFDFTIVRDTMYKYSKKAEERFFTFPVESFLMARFAGSKDGLAYLKSKPDALDKRKRLLSDLDGLHKEAIKVLENGDVFARYLRQWVEK